MRRLKDISIVDVNNCQDLSGELLMRNGKLKLLPVAHFHRLNWNEFRFFCHNHARYGIPTTESIDYIKNIINGRRAIEIGAGHGDYGFHLNIPMTDAKIQEIPAVKLEYAMMGQPVIEYPEDVEKMDATKAINEYKPEVVIASWVTTFGNPIKAKYGCNILGIHENELIKNVDTYILIGNVDNHGDKPIMKEHHEELYTPWIVSRARNQENNRIWVWNRK